MQEMNFRSLQKGEKLKEGKTKILFGVGGRSDIGIFEVKPDITAYDDPSYTKQFNKKRILVTTINHILSIMVKMAGIPIAYQGKYSHIEYVSDICEMIKLELVARRYIIQGSSYLKRHPEMTKLPYRFDKVLVEFFLKTNNGRLINRAGQAVISDLDATKGEEDPFIPLPCNDYWRLFHSKHPIWTKEADLQKTVSPDSVFPEKYTEQERFIYLQKMEEIIRLTFLLLEKTFSMLGYRLIDLKLEFGIKDGKFLRVGDEISPDNFRLCNLEWEDYSKQSYRNGESLEEVEAKYTEVAEMLQKLIIPEQAIILWRDSESGVYPVFPLNIESQLLKYNEEENWSGLQLARINVEKITLSGYQETNKCLAKLEELISKYPNGGVIIAKVEMNNVLGSILATHTTWPVISIPKDLNECVYDNIQIPFNTPLLISNRNKNAAGSAMTILSQQNPFCYMIQRKMIEDRD